MSDIKLSQIGPTSVAELPGEAVQVEKSLQTFFEKNLEALLGVRFLATEYSTGPIHGGRIDTLGIDEDGSPIIIEYKRAVNENVVSQGLFYLDWLLDHRGDFELLVHKKFGATVANEIDWRGPRLICVAGAFTRYDEHAVRQIARNIELLRYRRFGDKLLMIELVHAPKQARTSAAVLTPAASQGGVAAQSVVEFDPHQSALITYRVAQTQGILRDLFDAVFQYLQALGDDVQVKEQKFYIAFKRIKNFACLEVYPQEKVVRVHLKVDPKTIDLEDGFTRDMTGISHFGTGNLQVTMRTMADFTKAQPLLGRSYEVS